MQISDVKIFRRKSGTCVEFVGADGVSIEVELHGDDLAELTDEAVITKARATMTQVGKSEEDVRDEAGVDQTLNSP